MGNMGDAGEAMTEALQVFVDAQKAMSRKRLVSV